MEVDQYNLKGIELFTYIRQYLEPDAEPVDEMELVELGDGRFQLTLEVMED